MSWRLRLACRVCLAIGIDDPEAWLSRTRPRTLALWEAFYRVEPWGFEAERSAGIMAMLSSLISAFAASCGAKIKPQKVSDFMPQSWVGNKPVKTAKPKGRKQMRAAQQICAAMFPTADRR